MIRNLIGAAIGRHVAGRYSGARGALIGAAAPWVIRRAFGPVGLLVGGGYLAKRIYDRRRSRRDSIRT